MRAAQDPGTNSFPAVQLLFGSQEVLPALKASTLQGITAAEALVRGLMERVNMLRERQGGQVGSISTCESLVKCLLRPLLDVCPRASPAAFAELAGYFDPPIHL